MTDVRDLLPETEQHLAAWFGTVSVAPADLTDFVTVILPEYDSDLQWGPCRWQSRDATSLPAIGDECLVMFDNRKNPWVVAWWPFS